MPNYYVGNCKEKTEDDAGMINVKDVIFAFICINLAVFIVNSIGTFNQLVNRPYYTPEIISRQFNVPSNWQALIPSGAGFAGGAIANAFSAVIWMFFVIEYLGGRKVE